jgi:hypothetical protein
MYPESSGMYQEEESSGVIVARTGKNVRRNDR